MADKPPSPVASPATQNAEAIEKQAISAARARIKMAPYKATLKLGEAALAKLIQERHEGMSVKQFRLALNELAFEVRKAEEGIGKAA